MSTIVTSASLDRANELRHLRAAASVVHAAIAPTPQYCWPLLSQAMGTEVWVKHENHTEVGAFKLRGGLTYLHALRQREPQVRGVIAASTRKRDAGIGTRSTPFLRRMRLAAGGA